MIRRLLATRSTRTVVRFVAVAIVVASLVPVAISGALHVTAEEPTATELRQTAENVTFVTTQGGSVYTNPHAGRIVAVHTPSKKVVWQNEEYRRYMDVDPLDRNRVLFVAGERIAEGEFRRVAVVMNWRTGETLRTFEVPWDTHDVDHLEGDRYAVADKVNDRIYVHDASENETVWEFDFRSHFAASAGGGIDGDYTHLNDVDAVDNGSAFLASPRNFDRVFLIDRSNRSVRWTLGEEDDYETLYEQHNPVVISQSPLTVLVADSENDRIVEYRRTNGTWTAQWGYRGTLVWPRDADRLPNGNTLIAATGNDKVLEVTPSREVVWEFDVGKGPYDVERLQHGDEPSGPPMSAFPNAFDSAFETEQSGVVASVLDAFEEAYSRLFQVATWILPVWVTRSEFVFVLTAVGVLFGWTVGELALAVPSERLVPSVPSELRTWVELGTGVLGIGVGGALAFLTLLERLPTGNLLGVGLALVVLGASNLDRSGVVPSRLSIPLRIGLGIASATLAVGLVYEAVSGRLVTFHYLGLAVLLVVGSLALWPRSEAE